MSTGAVSGVYYDAIGAASASWSVPLALPAPMALVLSGGATAGATFVNAKDVQIRTLTRTRTPPWTEVRSGSGQGGLP